MNELISQCYARKWADRTAFDLTAPEYEYKLPAGYFGAVWMSAAVLSVAADNRSLELEHGRLAFTLYFMVISN